MWKHYSAIRAEQAKQLKIIHGYRKVKQDRLIQQSGHGVKDADIDTVRKEK